MVDAGTPAADILTMVNIVHGHITLPRGRRERKKAEARRRLYEAAIRLFRSRGFDETPVEAITEAADTSKGTFFNYFRTKEHVLAAYHDEMTGSILAQLAEIPTGNAEAAVQAAMGACADWVENDPEMGRIVVAKVFGNPVLRSADMKNAQRFMEWFGGRVEAGLRAGELRRDLDVRIMLSMLAAVLSSTLNAWVVDSDSFDLREMLERKTRFVFDAARAPARRGEPSS